MSAVSYIHPTIALLCLLMALGSVPFALREPAPRSGWAFCIGYIAFAVLIVSPYIGLWLPDLRWMVALETISAACGFTAFWWGCWIRSGQEPPRVFLGALGAVWLLSLGPWLVVRDEPTLRLTIAFGCVAAGTLSATWAIWARKQDRNIADLFVVLCFMAILVGQSAIVLLRDLFTASDDLIETAVGSLLPAFFIGIGFFSNMSYAFDAMSELDRRSETDPLTGLLNRRAFDKRMTLALDYARRYKRPMSLVMADLDHFKRINDTWGHASGDAVLKQFADLICRGSRSIDFVARLGGEEFVVVMPESNLEQAKGFAERIRQACERRLQMGGKPVTASFGIVSAEQDDFDAQRLLIDVDRALYDAKEQGRNRVVVFDDLSRE